MGVTRIEDESDERLADYSNVPDADLLHRRNLFVAEGRLVVRRLLESGRLTARSVMVTPAALAPLENLLVARPGLPVYVVPQSVMDGVTGFNVHRGCLAIGGRPPRVRWQEVAAHARRVAVLERVGNADNVGAVFRSAAAFSIDGILLGPACADPLYRKAIRTSMGASLSIPFAAAEPWPDALRTLGDSGWMVTAMVTQQDAPALHEVFATTAGRPVAVAIGHEGEGLSREAIAACTHRARIPMAADVDSLNAATAASIAFYELAR